MNKNKCKKNLGHLFMMIGRLHYRMAYAKLSECGIPIGAPPLLRTIRQNNGCHQKELSDNCHLKPATVSSALLTMEKEGLIRREVNMKDRRSICLWITEKGERKLNQADKAFDEIEKVCLQCFSLREKEEIEYLLQKIINNMLSEGHELSGKGETQL